MPNDPTLLIGDVPTLSLDFPLTLDSNLFKRLVHRRRYWGGSWEMTFFIPEGEISAGELDEWFYSWLMFQIAEYADGTIPWKGVVWEMARVHDGAKRRRSMTNVYNAVKTVYTLTDSTLQDDTDWQEDAASISRYLRRELIIWADGISLAEAEAQALMELNKGKEPLLKTVAYNTKEQDGLYVTAVGMSRLLNNIYATVTTPNGLIGASTLIGNMLTTDIIPYFPFISAAVTTNAAQVEREQRAPTRCGDLIDRLSRYGNGVDTPYRYYVDEISNVFIYAPLDNTPTLEWWGQKWGGLKRANGDTVTWSADPGVVVDKTLPDMPPPPGSFLQRGNHDLIEQFSMWQGSEFPSPELENPDEDQLLANIESYLSQQTDEDSDRLHTPDKR